MESLATPLASVNPDDDDNNKGRIGEVKRVTKETNVFVKINLDGSGVADSSTCIPFLDHMLDQLASHGLFDVHVRATRDIRIDDYHSNEDVALAIGTALLQALGDRKGINRFGDFSAPLDEALIHVSLDLSGRPHLNYDLRIPTQRVGTYDTQLVEHFFQSLVNTSGMTLHIRQLAGKNSHHIIEATFKAFARALRQATEYDPRRLGTITSNGDIILNLQPVGAASQSASTTQNIRSAATRSSDLTRAKRKKTSDVWNYFRLTTETTSSGEIKENAICKFCSSALAGKSSGGTGHLRRHADKCIVKYGARDK